MLKKIADEIWTYGEELKLRGGASMPCSSGVLRLPDGQLALHAPLAIDDATAKEIDSLGDVRFLIAPNRFHWMFLKAAKDRYPKARVLGAAGLSKKVGPLAFERLPERDSIDGMRGVRVQRMQGAPGIEEHVIFHEPSRSLLVTDLMFNVHECRSFVMSCVLRLGGAWKKPSQSFFWRLLVKDRAAAGRSAAEILSWDFERVVVAHGDAIEDDAREKARRALAWMTKGAPPLLGAGSVIA